ncbi:MAG: hypothetical protein P8020_15980 [Acidobacteriota bacterium]|jgi:hypothetical protein
MKHYVRIVLSTIWLVTLVSSAQGGAGDPSDPPESHEDSAQQILDSLSGTLRQLSAAVRNQDYSQLANCFHPYVRFGALLPPGQTIQPANDLVLHSMRLGSNVRSLRHARAEVVDDWRTLLSPFQRIDVARFLTNGPSTLGTAPAWIEDARLEFAVAGKGHDGTRLWVAGEGRFDADFVPGRGWRFSRLEIDRVDEYRLEAGAAQPPKEVP